MLLKKSLIVNLSIYLSIYLSISDSSSNVLSLFLFLSLTSSISIYQHFIYLSIYRSIYQWELECFPYSRKLSIFVQKIGPRSHKFCNNIFTFIDQSAFAFVLKFGGQQYLPRKICRIKAPNNYYSLNRILVYFFWLKIYILFFQVYIWFQLRLNFLKNWTNIFA